MKLNELLAEFVPASATSEQLITDLTLDSRTAKCGELFFAFQGFKVDGRKYIADAIRKGVAAILCENDNNSTEYSADTTCNIPIFHVSNLRKIIGLIAAKFYNYPARAMTIIGVTGTNGKTSCTHLIAKLSQDLGQPTGVIGTLGAGFPDHLSPLKNTTPDAITLQQHLATLRDQGASAVAMEVSSHALEQGRIQGIDFNIGVFTNLTRDHLDYHGDMENYGAVKKLLFLQPSLQTVAINLDDEFGLKILNAINPSVNIYGYGTEYDKIIKTKQSQNSHHFIGASEVKIDITGIKANITTPWGSGILKSNLLGRFNLSNLLAVISVLGSMGFTLSDMLEKIALLQPLAGRMESFGGGEKKPLVVVDYAHTPDALEQVLRALREHCLERLWCVFGCGGDRDRGKRPLMGQIAERYSDNVIVTSDNPRTENPQQIIDEIITGLLCPWAIAIEPDRRAAIAQALDCAQAGDIVLIAGRGQEQYQIIGDERIPFSDVAVVKTLLESLN